MIKKINLLLFIISIIILTGCISSDDTVVNDDSNLTRKDITYDGWQDYENSIMGFEIQIPSNWEVDERDMGNKDYRRTLFNISDDLKSTTLAVYMDEDRDMKKIRKETGLFEGIKESKRNINGLEIYEYVLDDCNIESDCSKDIDIPFNEKVYTFRFDLEYSNEVEKVIGTFNIL